jgi:pyruvate formate lyase activating enzyme
MTLASSKMLSLQDVLDSSTIEGVLYEKLKDDKLRCHACAHRCVIFPGKRGACKVRFNEEGTLRVPYGYAAGIQSDPVEKKPYFHVMPGSNALTFGMLGCDLHCSYCQNWVTSQALRDDAAGVAPTPFTPDELLSSASRTDARVIVSSYNEPLITAEWSRAIFQHAKDAGFVTGFVSNGNATREALDYIEPYTDCYKVDLKSMRQENYRNLGGELKHILWTIEALHSRNFWLEVLTLVIPGFNDSNEELREAARFVCGVSPDIPWHVTGFHKDYHMTDPDDTSAETLVRAAEIGAEAGLNYVYAGNRPGDVGPWENTYCPGCRTLLVERFAYVILGYHLTDEGHCPKCDANIPGLWPKAATSVQTGTRRGIFSRRPRRVSLREDG